MNHGWKSHLMWHCCQLLDASHSSKVLVKYLYRLFLVPSVFHFQQQKKKRKEKRISHDEMTLWQNQERQSLYLSPNSASVAQKRRPQNRMLKSAPLCEWGCSSVGWVLDRPCCWGRFDSPVRQGIFLLESTFCADSLTVSISPPVQLHLLISVSTFEIPSIGRWKYCTRC